MLFPSSLGRFALALSVSSVAVACTQSTESTGAASASVVEPDADAGPAPVGPRIESVTALGTGCPNDATWESAIAEDGQSVTLKLHAHDTHVVRGDAFEIKDCTIALKVADAAGHEVAIGGLSVAGYASLQGEGMRGEETIKSYVQGNPAAGVSRLKELTSGPGSAYTIEESLDDAVWSPCGGGRDLNVQTRKVLRNNPEKTGYGFIGGESLVLRLRSRACSG